jgi:hypothetical protein
MKHRWIVLCLLFLTGVSLAGDYSLKRPTLSNNPRTYLKNIPLDGSISVDDVLSSIGTPDKTFERAGQEYLTYNISPKANGVIEYTYVIKDGKLIEATYVNSGNFFGVTQRESAKALQSGKASSD